MARKLENYQQVFHNLYYKKVRKNLRKPKFKVGDRVRLAVQKDLFEKAYIINWSDRVYRIRQVLNTVPRTYTVEDERGKQHKGKFYEQELQKNIDQHFRIESILSYKTINGKCYSLVKWIGYDNSFHTWEPVEKIQPINGSDRHFSQEQDQKK